MHAWPERPSRPEPRRSTTGEIEPLSLPAEDVGAVEARIDALESAVQALNVELRSLRLAIETMGPLPDHLAYYVPVSRAEIVDAAVIAARPVDILAIIEGAPRRVGKRSFFSTEAGARAGHSLFDAEWTSAGAEATAGECESAFAGRASLASILAGAFHGEGGVSVDLRLSAGAAAH